MKNFGEFLNKELSRKQVKRKDFCAYLEIHPQNLGNLLKKESVDAIVMEKACKYLGVDPAVFFEYRGPFGSPSPIVGSIDQDVKIGSASVNVMASERELMEKLLAEKTQRIESLEASLAKLQDILGRVLSGMKSADK